MISWHPGDTNGPENTSMLAMTSVKFQFKGKSADAAAAPEMGRSALDAVELMNAGRCSRRGLNDPDDDEP